MTKKKLTALDKKAITMKVVREKATKIVAANKKVKAEKVKPKRNKEEKLINEELEDIEDLGGSEPIEGIKNLKLIVNDGKTILFQDKVFTYAFKEGYLKKL